MFDYGNRIKSLINKNGITSRQLAIYLEVSPSQINRIENGNSMPSVQILDKIIEYFGISYSDFFNDDTSYQDVTIKDPLPGDEKHSGKMYYDNAGRNIKITNNELDMIMAYRKASMPEKTAINVLLEQYKDKEELEVRHA